MPRLNDNELRFALAAMVIAPYVLALVALTFFAIPPENKDLFLAGMSGLSTLSGLAAGWAWPKPAAPANEPERDQ